MKTHTTQMLIYHILPSKIWERIRGNSFYEAESLSSEGFIHCSYEDQLDRVIERYYPDAVEIVVLGIDANRLTSPLVSEPSTNDESYPHIYGPINLDAVVQAVTRPVGSAPS